MHIDIVIDMRSINDDTWECLKYKGDFIEISVKI
jgi:hypothetical protein